MNKSTLYGIFVVSIIFLVSLSSLNVLNVKGQEDTWITLASMPTPRCGLGLAVVNNKIYAIGGKIGDTATGANEMFNPATNRWTPKTPMPTPRAYFALTTYQNKIYVIAGSEGTYSSFINTIEVYDTITDTWTSMDNGDIDDVAYLNAHTIDDKIYVVSGTISPFITGGNSKNNYCYSLTSKYWSKKESIPYSVSGYASVVVDEKIYVIGGREVPVKLHGFTQIYDSVLDKWDSGVTLPSGEYFIYGASTSGKYAPKRIHVFGTRVHYVFDFDTNKWTSESLFPSHRNHFQVAVIDDFIYVIGGRDQDGNEISTNEVYTPIGHKLSYNMPYSKPAITPTPTISPTPTIEPTSTPTSTPDSLQTKLPSTLEIVTIVILTVVALGLVVNLVKKRRS